MNRIVRVDLVVLLLAVMSCCSTARPLGAGRFSVSGSGEASLSTRVSEVRDLLSAGNAPKKNYDGMKRMKNTAGKSDEGGFYKTYGSDADGEKGYVKQTYSKGDHGYKTLDTFHKKDGDNYGFEEHSAFGKAREGDKGGKNAKSGSYTSKGNDDGDHEAAGTEVETHYVEEGGDKAAEEGEGAESGESASYTEGDDGEHYGSDGDAGHYSDGDSDSGNYGNSDGYNEKQSSGGSEEGAYGSSSSYSTDGEGGGEYY